MALRKILGFLKVRDQLKDSLPKRNEELEVNERLLAAYDLSTRMPTSATITVSTVLRRATLGFEARFASREQLGRSFPEHASLEISSAPVKKKKEQCPSRLAW